MLKLAVILLVIPGVLCKNCTNVPDGNYEISCRSYSTCTGGVFHIVACQDDTVYNKKTNKCDDPKNVEPPCGQQKDCSAKKDGHYADLDTGCHSYYTCAAGSFFGHNYCAGLTVFDEGMETCNWPNAVKPPCGTYKPTSAP